MTPAHFISNTKQEEERNCKPIELIACLSSARLQQGGHRLLRRKQAIAISSNLVAKEKALSVADLSVAVSSYETKDNLFSRADVVCQARGNHYARARISTKN